MLSATLTTLTSGTVVIKADPGYKVALSGSGLNRVLKVAGGSVIATIDNITIMNGYASTAVDSGFGGGVLVSGGTLTVNNVTFTGNTAQGGRGGAILNHSTLHISNSTFVNNRAVGAGSYSGGGAVYNASTTNGATADITNSTFYNNTALSTNENAGGGAVYNNSAGTITITNSTLYGNVASSQVGGGVYTNSTGTTTLTNTIVARTITSLDSNCYGTLTTNTSVSGGDATCATDSNTLAEIFGVAAPALADNGGQTQTFAIPNSGPAYNLSDGDNPVTTCPANDQREVPRSRTDGDACDAGSYEYHTASTTELSASPVSPVYGDTITLTATVTADATGNVKFYDALTNALLDTVALSSGQATYSLGALNAGSYSYNAVYTGDTVYDTSKSNLDLTVDPLTVTVTPTSGQSKVYGSVDPAFAYTWSPSIPSSTFTGTLSREAGENVGSTYMITPGNLALNSSNYAIDFEDTVTFAVTPLTVVVTPDTGLSKNYGSTDPVLTYEYAPELVGTDTFTGALGRAEGENEGSYNINKGDLALNNNYTLTFTTGVNFTITPAELTVWADNKIKLLHSDNPDLTYTITGFVNGEKEADIITGTPGLTTTADKNSPVGDYDIIIEADTLALKSGNNYTFNFVNGKLTVTPGVSIWLPIITR